MSELYTLLKSQLNTPCNELVGRDKERETVKSFFKTHFENGDQTGCLYISGNPGTGKTALIQEFINHYNNDPNSENTIKSVKKQKLSSSKLGNQIFYLNCTSLNSPKLIYSKLIKLMFNNNNTKLNIKDDKINFENLILHNNIKKNRVINLVILDEIDQLLTRGEHHEELNQLIEWTFLKNFNLSLIGISNTLNLLEKFLPKLKAKGYEPLCINFLPYNSNELSDILKFKCQSIQFNLPDTKELAPLIHSNAIEFCARKVASSTGDLRRAIDLTIQTVDCASEAYSKSDQKEVIPVTINHALQIVKQMNQDSKVNQLKGLNISQQLILSSILHLIKSNQLLKFDEVYDKYCELCDISELFLPISQTEFQDCLNNLESIGCLTITKKKVKKSNLVLINLLSMESDIINCIKLNKELDNLLPK